MTLAVTDIFGSGFTAIYIHVLLPTYHNFHSCSGSHEDKTLGLHDNGDEFNKHVVWTRLSWSYFMVFNSQTRKGNDSFVRT